MKIAIMQPYFMPYIGYWQLIKTVDKFVIYDDVNFIKRGWVNRNNILINGEKKLFSLSLKEASQNKLFNEIYIIDNFVKFRRMIELAYSKAPYFSETMVLLDEVLEYEDKLLSSFIKHSIECVIRYLGIDTELLLSSELKKDNTLRGQDKILNICSLLKAEEYYNPIGGKELYDKIEFLNRGIQLNFLESKLVNYKQLNNDFVSGLSIIDVLMFNGVEEINNMLDKFNLV